MNKPSSCSSFLFDATLPLGNDFAACFLTGWDDDDDFAFCEGGTGFLIGSGGASAGGNFLVVVVVGVGEGFCGDSFRASELDGLFGGNINVSAGEFFDDGSGGDFLTGVLIDFGVLSDSVGDDFLMGISGGDFFSLDVFCGFW